MSTVRTVPATAAEDDQMLEFEDWLIDRIEAIPEPTGEPSRAKVLLRIITTEGEVSTKEMESRGYRDAASAKRDARNFGFTVETKRRTIGGESLAIYYLSTEMTESRATGAMRKNFSAKFRRELVARYGAECMICKMPGRSGAHGKLQPDHRIPFDIAGDISSDVNDFMPACGSCNRAKSWECEHCPNWTLRDIDVCRSCYWAIPDGDYTHVATKPERRLSLVWEDAAVDEYDSLREEALARGIDVQELIKNKLFR